MPVGKGSLKRATKATQEKKETKTAETTKNEISALTENNVIELDPACISFRTTRKNDKMIESVKKYGVILPVVVVKEGEGWKAVDGARRLTALVKLGVPKVKAVVLEGDAEAVRKEIAKFAKVETVVQAPAKDDIHEEKFKVVRRLGEDDFPTYLL